jgi:hypothetical protein
MPDKVHWPILKARSTKIVWIRLSSSTLRESRQKRLLTWGIDPVLLYQPAATQDMIRLHLTGMDVGIVQGDEGTVLDFVRLGKQISNLTIERLEKVFGIEVYKEMTILVENRHHRNNKSSQQPQ